MDLKGIIRSTRRYNFHSHTQFCDGHAPMCDFVKTAGDAGFTHYGFSPHSPVPVESGANMRMADVAPYLDEVERLRSSVNQELNIYASMEIDFLGKEYGPSTDFFQKLPLDYRIGSVHFVPNQSGICFDCDGSPARFARYLKEAYAGDLRYVVEKYFEMVLTMIEYGGLDIIGHFDKIAGNASSVDAGIENNGWYESLIDDVLAKASYAGIIVEINTKAFERSGRFYPAEKWFGKVLASDVDFVVNSDAHDPMKINSGRDQAFAILDKLNKKISI